MEGSEITLNETIIDGFNYLINRDSDNFYILNCFSDVLSYFDKDNGPHLKLPNNSNDIVTIPINDDIFTKTLIANANKMSEIEYYSALTNKKNENISKLIKATYSKGYEHPSVIQKIAIVELILGKDAMVQSKSGTGKTHTFLFSLLWNFDITNSDMQYVFITSSHEVANQIYSQAKELMSDAKIALCIGHGNDQRGSGFRQPIQTSTFGSAPRRKTIKEEIEELQSCQIVVCTMGKFYDMNSRKVFNLNNLKAICVDEFDAIVATRNTNRGAYLSTEAQMQIIMKEIPKNCQRVFFSATVTPDALKIVNDFFRNNDEIPFISLIKETDSTLEGIKQYYVQCSDEIQKENILLDLLQQCRISQAIIFVNNIALTTDIKDFLDANMVVPISSAVFHGKLSQIERQQTHKDFITNKIRLLISTDVVARGFDIHGINLVINFHMPDNLETYIHRVGRSGRYGRKGVAISLIITNNRIDEMGKVNEINLRSEHSPMVELPNDLANLL